jgi:hypothetical protein
MLYSGRKQKERDGCEHIEELRYDVKNPYLQSVFWEAQQSTRESG